MLHRASKLFSVSVATLVLAGLLGGCVVAGDTICDGTQKKEGETKRMVIGGGIYMEAKGGSCR